MEEIDKGEIVFCNITLKYLDNLKVKIIKLDKVIFSRKYNSNYPKLNINHNIISKIKSKNIIKDVEVINLDIIVRTGYIHKYNIKI